MKERKCKNCRFWEVEYHLQVEGVLVSYGSCYNLEVLKGLNVDNLNPHGEFSCNGFKDRPIGVLELSRQEGIMLLKRVKACFAVGLPERLGDDIDTYLKNNQ